MKKADFFDALRRGLAGLPEADAQNVLDYYGELIDDRVDEGMDEEAAVAALGSVDELAAAVLADRPVTGLIQKYMQPRQETKNAAQEGNTWTIPGGFRAISVQNRSADVRLEHSPDADCHVTYEGNGRNAPREVVVESGTLCIRGERGLTREVRGSWVEKLFSRLEADFSTDERITLWLPGTDYESLGVSLMSGDFDLNSGFRIGDVVLKTVSGDLRVEGFSGGRMRIETASGDVKLEGAELSDELRVSTASGDVNGENLRCRAAALQTASGDLGIELLSCDRAELKTASGDLELERVICAGPLTAATASGDLRLAGCDAHGAALRTVSGDVDAEFLRQMRYETHTVTGDVSLPADGAAPGADLCSIHTVSGDIRVTVE